MKIKINFSLKVLSIISITLFGLTGCGGYGSPQEVIQTAYKALMKNDPEAFLSTLTKGMQAKYGNPEGMAKLRESVAGFKKFSLSEEQIIDTEEGRVLLCNPGGFPPTYQSVDVQRIYELETQGMNDDGSVTPISKVQVHCEIYYNEVNHKGGRCFERNGKFCQISDLK